MKSMVGHVRHMMKHGARTMGAIAVMWPAGVALAKTPANDTCSDPLKCFSHEKLVTPQNVYKNLTYDRTGPSANIRAKFPITSFRRSHRPL
jgi:hypothetical protein